MVGLAFAIAASGNFPALVLSILWRKCTTAGVVASMLFGTFGALILIALSPVVPEITSESLPCCRSRLASRPAPSRSKSPLSRKGVTMAVTTCPKYGVFAVVVSLIAVP